MDFYNNDDKYNQDSGYRPVSYEEAQKMREEVRNGAVHRKIDATKNQYAASNNTPRHYNNGGRYYGENTRNDNNDNPEEMPYEIRSFREMNRRRSSVGRDGLGIVIVFLIIGLLFLSEAFSDIAKTNSRAKESEQAIAAYTQVEGTIIRVRKSIDRDFSMTGKSPSYDVWLVSYQYEYKGESYEQYQSFRYNSAHLYGFIDVDLSGKPTEVYVNPENPKQSLIRSYPRARFVNNAPFILFGVLMIVVAVIVYFLFDKGFFTVVSGGPKKQIHFGRY